MSDIEMTPLTPEEGGAIPPKTNPFGTHAPAPAPKVAPAPAASSGATTIQLKPVIRKPMIHKPTIGAKPPPIVASPAASLKKTTQNLKSVTGPIAAVATLKKTGIVAEGIITPAQQQAAKSKTSRISLESAMGTGAPSAGPAPIKTIRLRRPTDINKPQPLGAAPAPAPAAAPAPASPAAPKPTLKLNRPAANIPAAPTLGFGSAPASAPAPAGDIPDLQPLEDLGGGAEAPHADVPAWLSACSLVASLAAILVVGMLVYFFWREGVGPQEVTDNAPNVLQMD